MHKEIVFIVDDEPMHAQMMEDHLCSKYPHFEIHSYKTGEECGQYGQESRHCDTGLPPDSIDKTARNGIEILNYITKQYPDTTPS